MESVTTDRDTYDLHAAEGMYRYLAQEVLPGQPSKVFSILEQLYVQANESAQLRADLEARDAEFREEEKRRLALVAGMNELRADLATLRANHDLARKQNDHLMRVVEAIRDALKQALTGGEE